MLSIGGRRDGRVGFQNRHRSSCRARLGFWGVFSFLTSFAVIHDTETWWKIHLRAGAREEVKKKLTGAAFPDWITAKTESHVISHPVLFLPLKVMLHSGIHQVTYLSLYPARLPHLCSCAAAEADESAETWRTSKNTPKRTYRSSVYTVLCLEDTFQLCAGILWLVKAERHTQSQ